MSSPPDPHKWPGLTMFILMAELQEMLDAWEFSPYTEEEMRDIMKPTIKT